MEGPSWSPAQFEGAKIGVQPPPRLLAAQAIVHLRLEHLTQDREDRWIEKHY